MKRVFPAFFVMLLLVAAAGWGYVHFLGGDIPGVNAYLATNAEESTASDAGDKDDQEAKPADVVATVKTTTARKGTITTTRVLYGAVVPGKGSIETVSAPFECKVLRVLVRKGQEVAKGDELVEVGPSEDSRLSLEQAQNKTDMAKQELERVKQRITLKLATNEELLQATNAYRDAALQLESLGRKGVSKPVTVQANNAGIVNAVDVQEGAIVTMGAALLDVAALSKLEVRLGAEPDVVSAMAEGQPLSISSLGKISSDKIECPIRGIARTINPDTHLVDVFVTIPDKAKLMLGEAVQGQLSISSQEGLIVPRTAVLPEEGHLSLFVVKDGHAHEMTADLAMQNDQEAVVTSEDLHEGDTVVVLGNYELEDGMAVKTGDAS